MHINHYTCPFSHLILSGRCSCKYSSKDCIAEKEFGTCTNNPASTDCLSFYTKLKDNSSFVLKSHNQPNLSVGQQSKLKMGALIALQENISGVSSDNVKDIFDLVYKIKIEHTDFSYINFSKLMPTISKYRFRNKH
jgi:hypothetical protein